MVDKKNGPRLSTRLSISIATYYICSKSQKKVLKRKPPVQNLGQADVVGFVSMLLPTTAPVVESLLRVLKNWQYTWVLMGEAGWWTESGQ